MALFHQRGVSLEFKIPSSGQLNPSLLTFSFRLINLSSFSYVLYWRILVSLHIDCCLRSQDLYHIRRSGLDFRSIFRGLCLQWTVPQHQKTETDNSCISFYSSHFVPLSVRNFGFKHNFSNGAVSFPLLTVTNMLRICYSKCSIFVFTNFVKGRGNRPDFPPLQINCLLSLLRQI